MKLYEGDKDAVKIIEQIFHRKNWQVELRENLAERIERIVAREVANQKEKAT